VDVIFEVKEKGSVAIFVDRLERCERRRWRGGDLLLRKIAKHVIRLGSALLAIGR
jgi:hypothetical protein